MEYITEPWQVILLCIVGAVFGVCFWIWLRAGQRGAEADDAGPVEIIERGWDALINWRPNIMSSNEAVPDNNTIKREQRSKAVEPSWNDTELSPGTSFRSVIDYLEQCDDDMLLDILAQLQNDAGDYRYAESRVAKFIGGRVEDRLAQVRAVRDTAPPLSPGRQLRVRDEQGERLIPMDA